MNLFSLLSALFMILSLQTSFAAGESTIRYCDCHQTKSVNMEVFVRNYEGRLLSNMKADDLQNCVDVKMITDTNGNLSGAQIGQSVFSTEDLTAGPLYFGIRKKAMHTFQLKDFDPNTGGTLEILFLTQFSATDVLLRDDFTIRDHGKRAKTAKEILTVFQDGQWATFTLKVMRHENGLWTVYDDSNKRVRELIGRIAYDQFLGVSYPVGIDQMATSTIDSKENLFSEMKCLKKASH